MRRFVTILAMIIVVGGCGVFCGFSAEENGFNAVVVNVDGDVQVDMKADNNWIPAVVGMNLVPGCKMKSGYGACSEIVYDVLGRTRVRLGEDTHIIVQSLGLDFLRGSLFVTGDGLSKEDQFIVKTANAICGIKEKAGFGVDYLNLKTVVSAFANDVSIQGINKKGEPVGTELKISEGHKTYVKEDGSTTPPDKLIKNEKKSWKAWKKTLKKYKMPAK